MNFPEIIAGLGIIWILLVIFRIWHKRKAIPLYSTPQEIEITQKTQLLLSNGKLAKEGWTRNPLWIYDRKFIHANSLRIKEWDYYAIMSHDRKFCICATISDLGFGGFMALAFIDLENRKFYQQDSLKLFTFGSLNLSKSPNEDNIVQYHDNNINLIFLKEGNVRKLNLSASNLKIGNKTGLTCELELYQPEDLESMSIATSWAENRKAFYLNTKINCMKTEGSIKIGNDNLDFGKNVWTVLDWGRGFWTYSNTWLWSSVSGTINGEEFGWNLGYGFTDRSPASENVIIYKRKVHKLGLISIIKDKNDYMKQWTISGQNLNIIFTPILDRSSNTNFLIIKSVQHQLFGTFSGTVTLNDSTTLEINNMLGFAEEVYNRW